jgi:hypothetical protein
MPRPLAAAATTTMRAGLPIATMSPNPSVRIELAAK